MARQPAGSSRSCRDARNDRERKEAVELISFGLGAEHQQASVTDVAAKNERENKRGARTRWNTDLQASQASQDVPGQRTCRRPPLFHMLFRLVVVTVVRVKLQGSRWG